MQRYKSNSFPNVFYNLSYETEKEPLFVNVYHKTEKESFSISKNEKAFKNTGAF